MPKSLTESVSRCPFVLLLAFSGLAVLAQHIYLSPQVRAASSSIVISEVDADTPLAGTDTANEWFELQNVSTGSITLTGWTIADNQSSDIIPTVTIGPGGHVIVAATAAGFASEHPGFTGTVLTIADGAIGNGLANGGDALILQDSSDIVVDSLSWGSNTTALSPSAGSDSSTNTNQRNAGGTDTDTAVDWTRATETPDGNTNGLPTPTNPTGVGTANPSVLLAGNQTLLTVTLAPGSNPASTGLSVSGNLSSIGGSATQQFFDDGTNGDVVVGNNVFSYSATVSAATTTAEKTIPFSITDAQSRSGSGNISLTVASPEHLLMGNPSNAIADANMKTNYLILKTQYALSFNDARGTPNWTSWHLDNTWQGSVTRPDVDFEVDPDLPPDFHRVRHSDYTNTGFDRGHMCPSADRTSTEADNLATFLTTNIVPQAPDNNRGPWVAFEKYLRTLLSDSEIYILSGGAGTGGTGTNGAADTIAGGFVNVPAVTWKVALILPVGDNDLSRVDNNTGTIAVIVPNTQGISGPWQMYLKTVNDVEALTGYDFYSNVPTAVQDVIEARLDSGNLQFSAATYNISESVGSATITVTRTGGSAGAASVNFATANGTATGGASCAGNVDYVSKSGMLSWADGESGPKTFTVTICNDSVNEEDETINLALSNPSVSGTLGTLPDAALHIVNDDAPVLLTEENTEYGVALDSVVQTRDPFSLINLHNLSMDQRRRVSLFVWRLGLQPGDTASAVTVQAEDDQGRVYPLTVEYVGAVTHLSGVTQVVVVLPDAVVGAPRDLWVTVGLRGPASGRALIKIAAP
jgi:endonuclease G, mitochondrial